MATRKKGTKSGTSGTPEIVAITGRGIRTGVDFINLMAATMSDLANGRITSMTANAICNCGGKMLKCAELQAKHGQRGEGQVGRVLELAQISESPTVQ